MSFYWSSVVGFTAGAAFITPLIGRFFGVPMIAVAYFFALLSMICAATYRIEAKRIVVMLAGAVIFLALAVQAASTSQLHFFVELSGWLDHANRYFDAKLFMIFLNMGPTFIAACAVLLCPYKENVARGFQIGALVSALAGLVRTAPSIPLLIHVDYSSAYYGNPEIAGFSLVSVGFLCFAGGVAALSFNRLWMLAAVFQFMALWCNRKTEFIAITVVALIIWWFRRSEGGLWPKWRIVPVFAATALAFLFLHTDENLQKWQYFGQSAQNRVAMATSAVAGEKYVPQKNFAADSVNPCATDDACVIRREPPPPAAKPSYLKTTVVPFLFGHGLGAFAADGGAYNYPHNVIVESLRETGVLSTVLLILAFTLTAYLVAINISKSQRYGLSLSLTALGFAIFSLKAGDLSDVARLLPVIAIAAYITIRKPITTPEGAVLPSLVVTVK
jgi:hypothetical protein